MLAISSLTVSLEDKVILKNINLKVHPGEIHAIMGPNGSGKSSLAMTIAGNPKYFVKRNSRIKLNTMDIAKLSPDKRAKLGLFMAFQQPLAIFGVSVLNLLRLASTTTNSPLSSFTEFLSSLRQKASALQIPEEMLKRSLNDGFSGGEKKKMEALQAQVLKPKLAIFDEIDTGLDIDALKLVAKTIKELAKKETGIIIITHYQRLLKYIKPDYVHILINGQIVKSGPSSLAQQVEKSGYEKYLI
ncbi:Fe-S cluster assembly ATPase SufC [Candidatus Gottesmanbacteria bacterium]|nr:Fe-S cluster assembly ATPase SufC [Candidatus Gottesmanbacteria bacterium]